MKFLKELFFILLKLYLKPVKESNLSNEITILLPVGDDNWILAGIAKEIKKNYPNLAIVSDVNDIQTEKILIMHYSLLRVLFRNRISLDRVSVFFTHPRKDLYNNWKEFEFYFSQIAKLFIMNGGDRNLDIFKMYQSKLVVAIGGYEKQFFSPISGTNSKNVCFVSRYYDRKNPELILKIVQSNPDHRFIILGRGWEDWSGFSSLLACYNFRYIVTDYQNYNDVFRDMNYFITVSTKEGGPIPLLETMCCGITPISTDTGIAGDVIEDGVNGFLLERTSSDEEKLNRVKEIFKNGPIHPRIIINSVEKYDWQNFATLVTNKMLNE